MSVQVTSRGRFRHDGHIFQAQRCGPCNRRCCLDTPFAELAELLHDPCVLQKSLRQTQENYRQRCRTVSARCIAKANAEHGFVGLLDLWYCTLQQVSYYGHERASPPRPVSVRMMAIGPTDSSDATFCDQLAMQIDISEKHTGFDRCDLSHGLRISGNGRLNCNAADWINDDLYLYWRQRDPANSRDSSSSLICQYAGGIRRASCRRLP